MKTTVQFICKSSFIIVLVCIVFANRSFAQCATTAAPSYSNTCTNEYIITASASGTGVVSTISLTGGTCGLTYYNDYATQGVTVSPGATVSINITRHTSSSGYTAYMTVYVDWSNSGTYTAADLAGTMVTLSPSTLSATYNFTVPTTGIVTGTNLYMRMMLSESSSGAPCTATYGQAYDYYLNINCPTPPPIAVLPTSGTMCSGASGIPLTASGAGTGGTYTWSPASGLSATSGASVTAAPTATGITVYTVTGATSAGCSSTATASVTVNPAPAALSGTSVLCASSSAVLSDATAGGAWSSSNTAAATINSSGDVYSIAAGVTTISYTLGSCPATATLTVTALPPAITGNTNVCIGSTTTLSNSVTGGFWTSGSMAIATVTPSTGVVSGIAIGAAPITYTLSSCTSVTTVTVNPVPGAITGASATCPGSAIHLSDATSGGVWSSSNSAIATVVGGVVTGAASGAANISYTVGGCSAGIAITVSALSAITGATTVCPGATTDLSDASAGGVWGSSNTAIATVSGIGVVSGITGGTANISYAVGSCSVDVAVTVVTLAAITGPPGLCSGSTIAMSDATPGGVWGSANTSVAAVSATGVVSGIATGTTSISYIVGTCSVGVSISVNTLTPIIGTGSVCVGSITALSDATPGGVWSSTGASVATISTTGVVTGLVSGGTTILFTLGSCSVSLPVTVGSAISPISGSTSVCNGSTITLHDGTPGGTWSSGSTSIATISGAGVVAGTTSGTDDISYSVGSCTVTYTVMVDANNAGTITGRDTVCIGTPITLSDAETGGDWSSSSTSRATVTAATGIVSGLTSGIDTIKYTVTNACGTYTDKVVMHIFTSGACPTGIDPVARGQLAELKVFPNPNGGVFTMDLLSDADEEVHVLVTNIVGEKVQEFMTTTNKATDIRLDSAAGIYLLSASTTDGKYVARIVVY